MPEGFAEVLGGVENRSAGQAPEDTYTDELGDHSDIFPEDPVEAPVAPEAPSNAPDGFVPFQPEEEEAAPAKGAEKRIQELIAQNKAKDEALAELTTKQKREAAIAEAANQPLPDGFADWPEVNQRQYIAEKAAQLASIDTEPSAASVDPELQSRIDQLEQNNKELMMRGEFTNASQAQISALIELESKHQTTTPEALLAIAQVMQPQLFPKAAQRAPALPVSAPSTDAPPSASARNPVEEAFQRTLQSKGRNRMKQGAELIKLLEGRG